MNTRTVNIKLRSQGASAFQTVIFRPQLTGADGEVLLEKNYTATTDANGEASIDLPCPASYTAQLPSDAGSSEASFDLNDGGAIDLDALIVAGSTITDTISDYVDRKTDKSILPNLSGLFPAMKLPTARSFSLAVGENDLYTVPPGRKALYLDVMVTNPTGASISYYSSIKISGTYYRISTTISEPSQGIGHNFGLVASRGTPIVMNAGESISVNATATGMTAWAYIVEFDDASPLNRADLKTFASGNNTLYTVPTGKSIALGVPGITAANQPAFQMSGMVYMNGSGSTRTLTGIYLVPSGGNVSSSNQFAGLNTVTTNTGFSKFFFGGLAAGDQIIFVLDSNASGQYAWMNYVLY